ncbi:MAG: ChaN family lipoprotein, partial [Nitrospirota bacterium]|nr:ChaN family lipoprotein [Nitrospirota bacterium]
MNQMSRAAVTFLLTSVLISQIRGQNEPHPSPAIEFILQALDQHQAVGIGDLSGCEEAHDLIRSLIRNPAFPSKVDEIVVDFGNPTMQSTLDRYLLEGELVPQRLLRRVWDDTTRSVDLTWNSPVYEQFFDAVRSVNNGLAWAKRIRVVLADAPIDWTAVKTKKDLSRFEQQRSRTLADAVNAGIAKGRRLLVVTFPAQQFRTGEPDNARSMIDKEHPSKFFSIIVQGRFGPGATYQATEARQGSWAFDTAALIGGTWLGAVPVSAEPNAPALEAAVEAVLFVGRSDSLTIIRPSAYIFQDDEFWAELNRRWKIVRGMPFNLAAAGYDLRSRFLDPLPFMPNRRTPRAARATRPVLPAAPVKNESVISLADFVMRKIDQYPIIGLGDVHTCLEFHQAIHQLIRDPRLPGKVNDLIVEFGNPLFQAAIDRYVVDGSDVPREDRKGAWENAAMGWAISGSPLYEAFFDLVRDVNRALPKEKRMRIVLGDAPLNFALVRENPEATLREFVTSRSAPVSPTRETALAASVHAVLAANRRALIIAG